MSLEPGQVIGRYKVESTLGQGALAVTFKVVDPVDGTPYALKMMYSRDEQFRERLRRAGEAQSRVLHPNLVRVVETLEIEGAPGLVMEFVDGPTLEDWLKTGRPSLGLALKVFRGIVEGVSAAHGAGLVHRNLKPAKILLHEEGDDWLPKVNDFALVKIEGAEKSGNKALTQLGVSFGTPQYMAPEQFRDVSGVDHRADLFALGAILYELVCGMRAFDGNNLLAIYQKSAQGQYKSPAEVVPGLPQPVSDAIQRCLKVDPKLRPASCDELLELLYGGGKLDAVMAAPPVIAPIIAAPPPAPPPVAAPRAPTPAVRPAPAQPQVPIRDSEIEAFERPSRNTGLFIAIAVLAILVVLPLIGSVLAGVAWYLLR
jgi:serine/threonine-protein kinase